MNVMTFNQSLTNFIKWYTALETALGAISRVKKFATDTASEERPSSSTKTVENGWLSSGAIEFEHISASHEYVVLISCTSGGLQLANNSTSGGSSLVLRDISMSVRAGQKIGICGRSGRYASSMLK